MKATDHTMHVFVFHGTSLDVSERVAFIIVAQQPDPGDCRYDQDPGEVETGRIWYAVALGLRVSCCRAV